MRRDNSVFGCKQRIIRLHWLDCDHIYSRTCNNAAVKSLRQVMLIYYRASCGVLNKSILHAQSQSFGVYKGFGLVGKGAVNRYKVCP